jgi:hypothetical protein
VPLGSLVLHLLARAVPLGLQYVSAMGVACEGNGLENVFVGAGVSADLIYATLCAQCNRVARGRQASFSQAAWNASDSTELF